MLKLQTYLNFAGNTEDAFDFYKTVFGGEFSSLVRFKDMPMEGVTIPEEYKNGIMHISLPIGDDAVLMASDALESFGQHVNIGNNVYIFVGTGSKEEADRIFEALSAGGLVEMPMAFQPWGDYYGSFQDKFDVLWMVSFAVPRLK